MGACNALNILYMECVFRGNPILEGAANLGRGFVRFMFPFSNLKKERDDMDEFSEFNSVVSPFNRHALIMHFSRF